MSYQHYQRYIVPFLLALVLAGCGERGPRAFPSRANVEKKIKLVVFGVDGLEPKLLHSFLEQGRLPAFQRLMDNGSTSSIKCVASMCSPIVWTTVATGVMPEMHGVTGFTIDDVPVTSTVRRVPAFWNILAQYHILAATVGWMVTWPAETHSGIIVSDRAYWGRFQDKIYPPDAIDLSRYRRKYFTDLDDLKKFTAFPYDPDYENLSKDDPLYATNFLIDRRLMDAYVRDTMYLDMAMEVVERHNPEVFAVYLQGIDYTGHGFWKWYESQSFIEAGWTISEKEADLLEDVVPRYYEYTDLLIGKILDYIGGDPLVILLSDHGFGPRTNLKDPVTGEKIQGEEANLGDFISGNHRGNAALIISGPQARSDVMPSETITHLDILPTMLYFLGLEPAYELPGRVLREYFHEDFQPAALSPAADPGKPKPNKPVPLKSEHDEAILEELRSLGYIK